MNAILTSEIRKITTLKFWWALGIAPVVIGLFASAIYSAIASTVGPTDIDIAGGVASIGLYIALGWGMLFAALFGAVNAGSEFRHKTITPTFLTAPGRDRVLGAKLIVTALFGLAYGLAVEISSTLCLLLFSDNNFELSGTVFGILVAGLFATVVWSLIGAGLGLLLKSPTWAAVIVVAWFPFGEFVVTLILYGIGIGPLGMIAPASATLATVTVGQLDGSDFLTSPLAPIVLLVWGILLAGGGWLLARRRDVE